MRGRILVIIGSLALSLGLVGIALTLAQETVDGQPDPEAEANREAEAAASAEANPDLAMEGSADFAPRAVITAPLFAGIDDVTQFTYLIDPDTAQNHPLFDGYEVWGATYDHENDRVFYVRGPSLYEWPVGGAPNLLGNIKSTTANAFLSMVGLAYGNGTLYAIRNISTPTDPEGLYSVDPVTLDGTLVATYQAGAAAIDMGGLDYDRSTRTLYGTNDTPGLLRGLVEIGLDGDVTLVAPYPAGEVDLDGLAIGGGRAYIIPDEVGSIHIFDFATLTYTTPITSPWTGAAEVFAGGAWIDPSESIYFPIIIGSPLDEMSNR
jgi:hypothetical protein